MCEFIQVFCVVVCKDIPPFPTPPHLQTNDMRYTQIANCNQPLFYVMVIVDFGKAYYDESY